MKDAKPSAMSANLPKNGSGVTPRQGKYKVTKASDAKLKPGHAPMCAIDVLVLKMAAQARRKAREDKKEALKLQKLKEEQDMKDMQAFMISAESEEVKKRNKARLEAEAAEDENLRLFEASDAELDFGDNDDEDEKMN